MVTELLKVAVEKVNEEGFVNLKKKGQLIGGIDSEHLLQLLGTRL